MCCVRCMYPGRHDPKPEGVVRLTFMANQIFQRFSPLFYFLLAHPREKDFQCHNTIQNQEEM